MIYVFTKRDEWRSTGKTDVGQIPISWDRYVYRYWDNTAKVYTHPMHPIAAYKMYGLAQPPDEILLRMWTDEENFPRFDTGRKDDFYKA